MTLPIHLQPEPITPEDVKILKETFDKIRATLIMVSPFLASLLRKARVIATTAVPTAGVNIHGEVLINPKFFNSLDFASQTFIINHEVIHIALGHSRRAKNKDIKLWNLASDAVTNKLIHAWLKGTSIEPFNVTMDKISRILDYYDIKHDYDELQRMSVEEIYHLLEKLPKPPVCGEGLACPECGGKNFRVKKLTYHNQDPNARSCRATFECKCSGCGREWKTESDVSTTVCEGDINAPIDEVEGIPPKPLDLREDLGKVEGVVIQPGAKEIYDSDDAEGAWKREFVRSYMAQKMAGRVPGELESIVEKMLESKVSWRSFLRQAFRDGFGKTIVATWRKPSRKHPDFPGIRRFTYPTVRVLIDTSGSIGQKELEQFMGEVYELAKQTKLEIIMWDAKAYQPIEIENKSQVIGKLMKHIKGGGGTVIHDALVRCLNDMKHKDIVVILSDFEISDWDEKETQELLNAISAKASIGILVSTYREPEPLPHGWRYTKITV